MAKKIADATLLVLILAAFALLISQPINLTTADLGRHIKNGEEILAGNFGVLKTNFYSYTFPEYPTLNHHWLSGIVFFLIWKAAGFIGVHLFFILISLAAIFIFLKIASERSSPVIASLATLVLMPLILERNEIRPEIFSGLLAGIFLFVMTKFKSGQLNKRQLLVLPILEILWVNLHIYFFLGFAIVGAFLVEALIKKSTPNVTSGSKETAKMLGLTIASMLVGVFINPYGLKGVLAPFDIFKNYGYDIVENKSVFFLEKMITNPNFLIFKILFGIFLALIITRLVQNRRGLAISDLILAAGFGFAALFALRNMTLFALFALPISSVCVYNLTGRKQTGSRMNIIVTMISLLIILSIFSGEYRSIHPYGKFGLGLLNKNDEAAELLKSDKISGPIFNNYDIGGYLIFYLPTDKKVYPERYGSNEPAPNATEDNRRVFVDNRPEAYPAEFFQKIYIPMQEDTEVWKEQEKIYGFKTIIFSYRDYTPWGQAFLANITKDKTWSTKFLDQRVIIFTKNQ